MNKTATLIATALVISLSGCKGQENASSGTVDQQPVAVPVVKVISVTKETVNRDAVYSSTVQANAVNNIAPQTGGRIQKLNVEVGDFVSAGDILAEMDRVQLDQASLKLKNDETDLERVRQLLAEGGVAQSDFDQLELAFKVSRSSYENILENTILRSPIAGVITARNYDRGDMYAMAQPIYTVQQITPVKILVPVSETDYTKVRRGDKVSITADALPEKVFRGTVNRLYPMMDASSHTFNVEVLVGNERRELRPGMYARVTVNFGSNVSVTVPDDAVLKMQGAGTRTVFVLNSDNTVSVKVVTLGRHFDNKYEILSGLEEGDKVVVKGQSTLKSGQNVEVR